MLSVILKILSILGIILIVLLGIALLLILIMLVYPVSYKAHGEKNTDSSEVFVKVNWLLGLIRIRYVYPPPGNLTVKILWHTIFTSGNEKKDSKADSETDGSATVSKNEGNSEAQGKAEPDENTDSSSNPETDQSSEKPTDAENAGNSDAISDIKTDEIRFFGEKIAKIKYTIRNIYDKIKEIWGNIAYYINLLREEDTKQLFSHVCFRIGKVWKHIRPRHLKADVLFGTGSPDTTGYCMGVYGMLSTSLGQTVSVTPDFTEKILEGTFTVSGHIVPVVLLINICKILLDKKLMKFIKKLKAGRK